VFGRFAIDPPDGVAGVNHQLIFRSRRVDPHVDVLPTTYAEELNELLHRQRVVGAFACLGELHHQRWRLIRPRLDMDFQDRE